MAFLLRPLAFGFTLLIGVGTSNVYSSWTVLWPTEAESMTRDSVDHSTHPSIYETRRLKSESEFPDSNKNQGSGCGECSGSSHPLPQGFEAPPSNETSSESISRVTIPLKILSKKKAEYTEEARSEGIQGKVTLRVTFLASGGIGSITTVKGLPHGLTERAIDAVRYIRFEPETVNGTPRTTTRPVSYSFNIY